MPYILAQLDQTCQHSALPLEDIIEGRKCLDGSMLDLALRLPE